MDYATKEATRIDQPFFFGTKPQFNNGKPGGNKKISVKEFLESDPL